MKRKASYEKLEGASITSAKGFQAAGVSCGIKKSGRDLALLFSEDSAVAAGAFTRNLVQAAPVLLCREKIDNPIRAVVINSGNANACTGEQGMRDAAEMAQLTAAQLNVDAEQVLVCSTGVIGVPLPMDKIRQGIEDAAASLTVERQGGEAAAQAILTTDTSVKQVAYRGDLAEGSFHLAGISKGSGMICPNMATMLGFIVTDAKISSLLLNRIFQEAVDRSFNMISVDGETSTNDTALILANAASGVEITEESPAYELFSEVLNLACRELALKIVEDGEGITKVITLTVKGVQDKRSGKVLARSVLNSLLVKAAFYGEDANWGRIIAALGYAGIDFDPAKVDIYIGPIQVASKGGALPFCENKAKAILEQREVSVLVDLNAGPCAVTAWGTDLSHDYVSINSNYRS